MSFKGSLATSAIAVKGKVMLLRYVSILTWLPKYSKIDAMGDIVAGFTVGLTMMPQSIAYAALAGLSAQYGLYSAFMGSLVYVVFGTIKEVSIGPTSLMALLTFEYTQGLPVDFVILLSFLAGCVEFMMGLLNLGFLVNFISGPVTSGFTTATSLIIMGSQLKGLLGLKYTSHGFIDNIRQLLMRCSQIRIWDGVLGLFCIVFLLTFRKLKDINIGPKEEAKLTRNQFIVKKTLWFLSIARNAIVVLISSIVAYNFSAVGPSPFILSGKVEPGLPPFGLPPFSAQAGNVTYSFVDMCGELGSGIIVVPLVAVLANVAIAKAFFSGPSLDATQEMLTLGMCNVFGSFVRAMPTCGAFTRSAVSNASGARTPLVGLYSGTIILLALSFLTPYFYYIPRATLSSVLICAVMFMIDVNIMVKLWCTSKRDLFALVTTLVTCLGFGVEIGLLLGVVVNMGYLLILWARPNIRVDMCKSPLGGEYVLLTPDIGLFYVAMDFLQTQVSRVGMVEGTGVLPVVINCANFKGVDYTTAMGIKSLIKEFEQRGQSLTFINAAPHIVYFFKTSGVNTFRCCSSEEEMIDILFGEKLDLARSETMPMLGRGLQNMKQEFADRVDPESKSGIDLLQDVTVLSTSGQASGQLCKQNLCI